MTVTHAGFDLADRSGSLCGEDRRRRNFSQEETGRDIERLCETTPHGGGAIFAPLKLLDKRGDRRSAEVMGGATASPATCILHPLSGVSICRMRLLGAHFEADGANRKGRFVSVSSQ